MTGQFGFFIMTFDPTLTHAAGGFTSSGDARCHLRHSQGINHASAAGDRR
jgi:hypothetical protein